MFSNQEDFFFHNPLHCELFPAVRQMEAEIIRMTCNLFNSPHGYGIITGGGTESLLMCVLAHRNYARKIKNVKEPNLVMSITVHPGIVKACRYLNVEPIKLPVDKNG